MGDEHEAMAPEHFRTFDALFVGDDSGSPAWPKSGAIKACCSVEKNLNGPGKTTFEDGLTLITAALTLTEVTQAQRTRTKRSCLCSSSYGRVFEPFVLRQHFLLALFSMTT